MEAAMFPLLHTTYFDGVSPRAIPVTTQRVGSDVLIEGDGVKLLAPMSNIRWPERQRHGARLCYLPSGGMLSHDDGAAWDAWAQGSGYRETVLVGWMQNWSAVGVFLLACLALVAAAWVWGIPWMSRSIVAVMPHAIEQQLGDAALQAFEQRWLKPSALPLEQQKDIEQRLARAVALAYPEEGRPDYQLHLRASANDELGPNAFALPGGHVVLTDELAQMLKDRPDAITGVLAHELGHVTHRHGVRMVVQASLAASLISLVVGDVSAFLASVPVVLTEQAYSREAEREADQVAADTLKRSGLSPTAMLVFFERIDAWRKAHRDGDAAALPIALSSHPSDAERVRFFSEAR
jgi:predicted Zn-dependent protease